jgi:peroxiredoxin Q/BCP
MLKPGTRAPEFILPNESGDEVELSGLLQKGPLILYFYPADFTPGCTKEACYIRDIHDEILSVGLHVAGISPQDAGTHTRFRKEHEIPFTLLCDPEKTVVKMYDVDGPLGFGVRRATYLINQDRTIQDVVLADFKIERHKEFIEKAIILRESAGMRKSESAEHDKTVVMDRTP